MTSALIAVSTVAVLLLIALIWALRAPSRLSRGNFDLNSLEQPGRRHATYLSLIRHAASIEDLAFLAKRGYGKLQSRLHLERRKVVLLYLDQLRSDFERLTPNLSLCFLLVIFVVPHSLSYVSRRRNIQEAADKVTTARSACGQRSWPSRLSVAPSR